MAIQLIIKKFILFVKLCVIDAISPLQSKQISKFHC
jgi:hypothetical protein